ncbi:BTB/POZ domain-containing protein [Actinidia rufa]|uniref:Elongin-C n=1 Tax=Actinidia rufa TaxID=165716 RepID=A0A7J0FSJ6_9ERIC|nr:BTB/POZ domain-containing protein [Actinidia rufa]
MRKEDTVKLISAEGYEFIIDKKAAMVSQTIRNMLTSPGSFAETQHGEVTFPEISTVILEKICQYFLLVSPIRQYVLSRIWINPKAF